MENIIANNNLIAEFMGYNFLDGDFKVPHSNKTSNSDFKEWCPAYWDDDLDSGGYLVAPCNLLFHSDWNWLMEVVEKIESFKTHSVYIKTNGCTIQDENEKVFCLWLCREIEGNKIGAVFNACIEFIKWYNQQK